MTVEHGKKCCTIIYDDKEWDFIESLDEVAQRYIKMGLTTPYDYGYKPQLD